MPMSYDVLFASSNRNKFNEAKNILSNYGINLGFFKSRLKEIQAESIKQIAAFKVNDAYRQCHKPVIVEDAGLFIESLNGFPGTFSKNSRGNGWGYDPIFIPTGQTKTFAMISNKNEISHRYKALKKFSNWFAYR